MNVDIIILERWVGTAVVNSGSDPINDRLVCTRFFITIGA